MWKETLTYTDYDGNERTEDFLFNLTKAEVAEMELSTAGGIEQMVNTIVQTRDGKRIIEVFKDLILRSYGVKSPDGKRFIKSQDLRDEFSQTEAYSDLFISLATDDKHAAKFINGILPKPDQSSIPAPANK